MADVQDYQDPALTPIPSITPSPEGELSHSQSYSDTEDSYNQPYTQSELPAPQELPAPEEDPALVAYRKSFEDVLNTSKTYEETLNGLKQAYTASPLEDQQRSKDILHNYSRQAQANFNVKSSEFNPLETSPIPLNHFQSRFTDPYERSRDLITQWEETNKQFLDHTEDPDYLVVRDQLRNSITKTASQARQDIVTQKDTGGALSYLADLGISFAAGAVDPISQLMTGESTNLREHISRKNEGLGTGVAGIVGGVLPIAAASAVDPLLGAAAIGGQIAGSAEELGQQTLSETGNPDKAMKAALIEAGVQIPFAVLGGRAGSKLGKALTAESIDKLSAAEITKLLMPSSVGKAATGVVEGAAVGALQTVGTNLAVRQGLNEDQPLTEGLGQGILSSAIAFGALKGAGQYAENSKTEGLRSELQKAHNELKSQTDDSLADHEEAALNDIVSASQVGAEQSATGTKPIFPENKLMGRPEEPDHTPENQKVQDELYGEASPNWDNVIEPNKEALNEENSYDYQTQDEFLNQRKGAPQVISASQDLIDERVNPAKSIPVRLLLSLLKGTLGGNIELTKSLEGALGMASSSSKLVRIPRALGSDLPKFTRVLAHEIGHIYQYGAFKGGIKEIGNAINNYLINRPHLAQAAKELSQAWRPGWDGSYDAYRSNPLEIHADVISNLLVDPDGMRSKYPKLYARMDAALTNDPTTADYWKELNYFWKNPERLQEYLFNERTKERASTGDIEAQARIKSRNEQKSIGTLLKDMRSSVVQGIFDKESFMENIIKNSPEEVRGELFKHLNMIGATPAFKDYSYASARDVARTTTQALKDADIEPQFLDERLRNNQLREETTPILERLKDNPESLIAGLNGLHEVLRSAKLNKLADELKGFSEAQDLQGLTDFLSKLNGRLASVQSELSESQIARLQKLPPEKIAEAEARLRNKQAISRSRKANKSIEKLREETNKIKNINTREDVQKLLDPKSYNVRRNILNSGGYSIADVEASESLMRKTLGEDRYKKLDDIANTFYDGLKPFYDTMLNSDVISKDLKERIRLNKRSYVTTLVLKYFEGDDSVSGGFKSAVGTLSATGSESAGTLHKLLASSSYLFEQAKKNSIIDFARDSGLTVDKEQVPYKGSVWDEQTIKQKRDPKNTYIVQVKDGKPELYKLPGTEWKQLVTSPTLWSPIKALADLVQVSRSALLSREFKTIFSPSFAYLTLRGRNIKAETLGANRYLPSFLLWHSNGELRKARADFTEQVKNYGISGKIVPGSALEKAIKLGLLPKYFYFHGEEALGSEGVADAIYRNYGTELPSGLTTRASRLNNWLVENVRKIPGFKNIEERSFQEEITGKLMGFKIGKDLGMSDEAAAVFSRKNFGTPNSYGGGYYGDTFNKFFLFGKVHLNEMRAAYNLIQNLPTKDKIFQFGAKIIGPKLLTNPITGVAIATAVFGPSAGSLYKRWLDYVPQYDFLAKNIIPIGWKSPDGHYYAMGDIKESQLTPAWKAWYFRLPLSQPEVDTNMMFYPMMNDLFHGQFSKALEDTWEGAKEVGGALPDPIFQYGYNVFATAFRKTPVDFFTKRPLLNKDEVLGGNLLTNELKVTGKSALKEFQSIIPSNLFNQSEGLVQDLARGEVPGVSNLPILGAMKRSLLGEQNYGLYEKTTDLKDEQEKLHAELNYGMGSTSYDLLQYQKRLQSKITSEGGLKGLTPDERNDWSYLRSWRASTYKDTFNNLLNAAQKHDGDSMNAFYGDLERQSKILKPVIRGLK